MKQFKMASKDNQTEWTIQKLPFQLPNIQTHLKSKQTWRHKILVSEIEMLTMLLAFQNSGDD